MEPLLELVSTSTEARELRSLYLRLCTPVVGICRSYKQTDMREVETLWGQAIQRRLRALMIESYPEACAIHMTGLHP